MDYLENRFPKIAFTLFLNLMAIVDAQKEKASVSSIAFTLFLNLMAIVDAQKEKASVSSKK